MNALIFGISGQDGFYLTRYLLSKNYVIYGVTRDKSNQNMRRFDNYYQSNLGKKINIIEQVNYSLEEIKKLIDKTKPDHIYHLSGQSNIQMSFETSNETFTSFVEPFSNILKTVAVINKDIKIFNPMSSDCFSNIGNKSINIDTQLEDNSPYSKSKNFMYKLCKKYEHSHNIDIKNAFLFNHESHLRENKYVLKKICNYLFEKRFEKNEKLTLGNIDIVRNWGLAEEFVKGFYLLMKSDVKETIICSPNSYSIRDLLEYSFTKYNLDYNKYVDISEKYIRKGDIKYKVANSSDIKEKLKWSPECDAMCVIDYLLFDKELFKYSYN
jgi:GDPmannose 4,6-dehydratase